MNRNRNLTVESLEGKMLLASSLAAPAFLTAHVATLPHAPATGTGLTAFASPVTVTGLPHTTATLPHAPATGTRLTAF